MTFKKEIVRCIIHRLAQFHVDVGKIRPMLNTYLAVCRLKVQRLMAFYTCAGTQQVRVLRNGYMIF